MRFSPLATISTSLGALLASSAVALAAPIIDVGNFDLLPDTSGQTIQIFVSGDEAVDGVNLFVATGDGGEAVGGTADSAPAITDLVLNDAGMLFEGRPQSTPDQTEQFWSASANFTSAQVIGSNQLLAELTIDTTGFTEGVYDLVLDFSEASGIPDTNLGQGDRCGRTRNAGNAGPHGCGHEEPASDQEGANCEQQQVQNPPARRRHPWQ